MKKQGAFCLIQRSDQKQRVKKETFYIQYVNSFHKPFKELENKCLIQLVDK